MKRKFKDPCIYCGAAAESSDHVVARKFFLVERRGDLPQAPACRRCNNRKSKLENYLMIVLPFGAKNADAAEILRKLVLPRLENKANAKLLRELQEGYARSGGTSIPFKHEPMEELFEMIAKGLALQHFGVRLGESYSAAASLFSNEGEAFFEQMLSGGKAHVWGDLGEGTFSFEGAQAPQYPELTVWRFRFYGGVNFGGDPNVNGPSSLAIAVTGRFEMIRNLRYSSFLKHVKNRNAPKVGRNDPCPCGSGEKHKKCHGSVVKTQARADAMRAVQARVDAMRRIVPTTYQPMAAHGYGPAQFEEIIRYVQQMRTGG
jgi:SEC-C motif